MDLLSAASSNAYAEEFRGFIYNVSSTDSSEFSRKFPAKNSMEVFVSSTFTDTFKERNILLEKILPKLQILCNQFRIRVVLVDMRYGVRDENTADHMTWIACERGISRCYRESGSIAFLSLQGDKYGYRPIPKHIDKEILEKRIQFFSETNTDSLHMVSEWYYLDSNSCPPMYVLKTLTDTNKMTFWDNVLLPLRELIRDMPFSEDTPDIIIDRSVTEYETRTALSLSSDSKYSRIYWIHRQFTGGVTEAQDPKHYYDDIDGLILRKKMDALLNTMTSELSPENRICDFHLPFDSYITNDDTCNSYLSEWEDKVYTLLQEQLDLVIRNKQSWEKDGYGIGKGAITGRVLQEFIHHVRWANLKCSTFLGRDILLSDCIDIVYETSNKSNDTSNNIRTTLTSKFQGICLSIVGVSGSGKTALLSKLAHEISKRDKINEVIRPVIIRFCGTTADSSNGLSLIHSISYQIRYLYNDTDSTLLSSDYDTAVKYFQSLLATYPIVLLIDSLDQLTNANEARSKISFLVGVRPHLNTRIIVSCLPDERDIDTGKWKYCYLCDTRLKEAEVARVTVPPLGGDGGGSDDNISDMIIKLLAANKRRVTEDQLSFALRQVSVEPTALYVHLATRIMSTWRSYDDTMDTLLVLQPKVVGIIHQIIDGLEREFGRVMTRCALGLMTFAVAGISDNEMQDLLSLDDTVMDSVFQYWQLETKRLPLHVWLRLRGALEGLIVERDSGCLVWYHRQLKETAESRYTRDEKKHLHILLGTYFANTVEVSVRTARLIASQPLTWTDHVVWSSECVINHRRCVEGSYHLCQAGLLAEAANELCSFELLCACAKIGVGYSLLDNIIQLHSILNDDITTTSIDTRRSGPNSALSDLQLRRVSHYTYWLRRDMSTIVSNPVAYIPNTVTTSQPLNSIARQDFHCYLERYKKREVDTRISSSSYWSQGWVVGMSLGGLSDFDSILLSIIGHSDGVSSVNFSSDGKAIVSGSNDNTVKVWDVMTGSMSLTCEGHSGGITFVCFSPNCELIVSGSYDTTVKVWEVKTGSLLHSYDGHIGFVTSVNFSLDGQYIVSGSYDNTVKVWDLKSSSLLYSYEGHSNWITSVRFSPDGQTIVSGSWDSTGIVWDVKTGSVLHTLVGHSGGLTSVNFSPDRKAIVSGSFDSTFKIWNGSTGGLLHTYEGHNGTIASVSFSPDGTNIVSGSEDKTIKVWDVRSSSLLRTYEGHSGAVMSVGYSPDGQFIVSGSFDSTVMIWDVKTSTMLHTYEGHRNRISSVGFSPDGTNIVSGSEDNTVKIWDVETGSLLYTYDGHSNRVSSVSFSPDGQTVVLGTYDNIVKIWDVESGSILFTFEGHGGGVSSVSISPDGQTIVSGSYDSTFKIWDVKTGGLLCTFEGHGGGVTSVSFSPNCELIVSGSYDRTVKVWDARTTSLLHTYEGHSDTVGSVSFSPDGQTIVSGSWDTTIRVWDVKTGSTLHTYEGHSDGVSSVNFSSDGKAIVSGSYDNTVKVWDVMTGSMLQSLVGHFGGVAAVSFSPNGHRIISGSEDGKVKVWDVKTGSQ